MSNRRRMADVLSEEFPIPEGLSAIIERAASDDAFRRGLLTDREGALAAAGLKLSPREKAILFAIPAKQLDTMIARFADMGIERRRFLEQTAACAVTVLGGASLSAWQVGCKKKTKQRAYNADTKEGGGHSPRMDDDGSRPGDPFHRRPPQCKLTLKIGEFRTLSGPERTPGKADIERLQDQLERICEAVSLENRGKVVYTFTVDATGAVKDINADENTVVSKNFDVLARRQIERIVFFESGEPSKVTVDIEFDWRFPPDW